MQHALFAAGCFWGVEEGFRLLPGVTEAVSGYTGGHVAHPTYEQVCSGSTGHAEAVCVTFDPAIVTYEALVRAFFRMHDPTQHNRQGPDVGAQYRSAIFARSEDQRVIAERVKAEVAPHYLPRTIATEIEPAGPFWRAEEYHQRYAQKHPGVHVCHF